MTTPHSRDFKLAENEFTLQVPVSQDLGDAGLGRKVVVPFKSRCRGAFVNIATSISLATVVQPFRNNSAQSPVRSHTIPATTGPSGNGDEFEYLDFESDPDDAGADEIFERGDTIALSSDGAGAASVCRVVFVMRRE